MLQFMGLQRVRHDLATEQQQEPCYKQCLFQRGLRSSRQLSKAHRTWGCHRLSRAPVHACSVTQPCPALCNPIGHNAPGSSVHGIFQARVLGWGAIAFSEVQTKDIQINYHFSSVVRVCLTLRSHDCSMPGFPVHHQLPDLSQTHVH